jgi:hypothetical protein
VRPPPHGRRAPEGKETGPQAAEAARGPGTKSAKSGITRAESASLRRRPCRRALGAADAAFATHAPAPLRGAPSRSTGKHAFQASNPSARDRHRTIWMAATPKGDTLPPRLTDRPPLPMETLAPESGSSRGRGVWAPARGAGGNVRVEAVSGDGGRRPGQPRRGARARPGRGPRCS